MRRGQFLGTPVKPLAINWRHGRGSPLILWMLRHLVYVAPDEDRSNDPRSIIAPNSDVNIARVLQLQAGELESIRDGSKAIFFWGWLDYIDAFDERRFLA
jgi:hypothetical protein